MKKFIFCAVGPIVTGAQFSGFHPSLVLFTKEGAKETPIKKDRNESEEFYLSRIIAELGETGWEMVSAGSVPGPHGFPAHYLYFKRSIE